MARTPAERRQAIVSAIVGARRSDAAATFVADRTDEGPARVAYEDRTLRLTAAAGERDRLDALLEEYRVFKVAQPATRKADHGVVQLSAVTDPVHAAEFVEALFREVYLADPGYELVVERDGE